METQERNKKIRDLRQKKRELRREYHESRSQMKTQNRFALEDLHDEYRVQKAMVSDPLKAEKKIASVEKKKENRRKNEPPRRALLEEIGNSVSHGVGALVAIAFLVLMILKAHNALSLTAAIVYGSCFFLQMLFSCLYHSFRGGSKVKAIFRRFDYSSIYLQIGGTFAPLYLIYMVEHIWGLAAGLSFFAIQWSLIALGITFVGVFGPGRIRWLHFTLYFVIGWSGLMFLPFWAQDNLPLLFWILGGGIVYTVGMIPFAALKKKKVAHFIWHLVVLTASILMATGIYLCVF